MRRFARARAAAARRPTLVAALIYAILALGFVSPALAPGKTLSNSDYLWFTTPWAGVRPTGIEHASNAENGVVYEVFQPSLEHTSRELPHVPLWNPYVAAGRPYVGSAQSAVFSPFSVPAYVLPFWTALTLIAALKLFVAAFGTYLLARALGTRFGGALLAGVVYGLSLYLVTWLALPHSSVWVLIPWLWLLTHRVVAQPGPLSAAGLAAVVGLQFAAGHPESSFHAIFSTVMFLALCLVVARRSGRLPRLRPPLLAFAAAFAGGVALAAAALLPFGEFLAHSADLHQRAGFHTHVPARNLVEILLPDFWGRPGTLSLAFFLAPRAFYGGALPLVLAGVALILRPSLERVAIAAFGVACMAIVVGTPLLFDVVTALPGFSSAHNGRMAILYVLCLALLTGFGLDELASRARGLGRGRIVGWFAVAVLSLPLAWVVGARPPLSRLSPALDLAWGFGSPAELFFPGAARETIRLAAVIVWLTVAGAGVALILLRQRGRLGPALFVTLAVAVVLVDLFRAGMGYNPAIDRDVAAQPTTPAIRYLAARRPARFAGYGQWVIEPTLALRYGLYDARGHDLPIEERYDRFWRSQISPEFPHQSGEIGSLPTLFLRERPSAFRALSLLGVRDVVQGPHDIPPRERTLRVVYDGPDARIYENERALPRAFVAGGQRVVAGGNAALRAVSAPSFDARRVAVTERNLPGVPPAGAEAGRASIVRYEPERIAIDAQASRAGVLVLSDLYYPGWKAKVDGRTTPIHRVDYLFRGVVLPPGAHRVEFRYEPSSWRIGWIVSLLALIGLAAAVVIGLRSRARGGAGPA